MSATLPKIEITFKQLADSFIQRSARGTCFLVVVDATEGAIVNEISGINFRDVKTQYTEENQQYIKDILDCNVYKLFVIKHREEELEDTLDLIKQTYSSGRITMITTEANYTKIIDWVKAAALEGYAYHCLCYSKNGNSKYCENVHEQTITFKDERGTQPAQKFLPTMLGILSKCNVERSATYFVCDTIEKVEDVATPDTVVNSGDLFLVNNFYNGENKVRVSTGVNTLTTFTEEPEDNRYIDYVEVQDMIAEDIREVFKNDYIGQMKNTADNQMLFIAAVNAYLKALADDEILDPDWDNRCDIDTDAQRRAWMTVKQEAADWDDAKVRRTPFKRTVFLTADIKITGAMENLKLVIYMN